MNQPAIDPDRPIAAEYALGLLDADQAEAFETAMGQDPALRASYAQWASHFAAQTAEIAPVTPPEHVFQNIDKAIFLQAEPERSSWQRFGWLPLIVIFCIAVIGFSFVI